jgi:hypothetical protein
MRRLGVLRHEVPDTPPEEFFYDLTALAAQIFAAPIALVPLVDETRRWFKPKAGLAVSETARDIPFCGHAIHQSGLFILPSAPGDERSADNFRPKLFQVEKRSQWNRFCFTLPAARKCGGVEK